MSEYVCIRNIEISVTKITSKFLYSRIATQQTDIPTAKVILNEM